MDKGLPEHVKEQLKKDPDYYSLYSMENIERCKKDSEYLGDVILANEKLIWFSIHKYVGKLKYILKKYHLDKDEILQLGRLAFIKSIKSFDTKKGIKFSSYAVIAISREVICFIRDKARVLKLSRSSYTLLNKIKDLEAEMGEFPSIDVISEELDEDKPSIVKALTIGQRVKYLDRLLSADDDNDASVADCIASTSDSEIVDYVYLRELTEIVRDELSELDIRIFKAQIDGYTQTETAKQNDISPITVSRSIKKIAEVLKEHV